MADFTIKTRDEGTLEFFCPDSGGYVRLVSSGRPGTLAGQICAGGGFSGNTLTADSKSLPKVARGWNKQRRETRRKLGI